MQVQFVEHGKGIIILQQILLVITHTLYKSPAFYNVLSAVLNYE